jgi:hypothetical protein
LRWVGPLAREGPPKQVVSRGTQPQEGLATESLGVKRDGSEAEAKPACCGRIHGEAKAHEGRIGHANINRVGAHRSIFARRKALKTNKKVLGKRP